jgi:hypothetical protein
MHHLFYSKMIDSEVLRIHHSNDGFIDIANNLENREIFLHHNLIYEDVYEAFVRRCNRLLNLIDNNNKIVFVYYNRYTDDFNDVLDFSNYFSDNKNIYVVGIFQKDKRMMRENVTSNDNKMLYESSNCKIYQNYNSEFIFNDITNKIMS